MKGFFFHGKKHQVFLCPDNERLDFNLAHCSSSRTLSFLACAGSAFKLQCSGEVQMVQLSICTVAFKLSLSKHYVLKRRCEQQV